MPSDSHSVVVLIYVQAILPHCGSLLSSLIMTARRPSVAVRGQGGIDLTASGLSMYCDTPEFGNSVFDCELLLLMSLNGHNLLQLYIVFFFF